MPLMVTYVVSAMLFLGAAPLPYGYYTLLRVVAFVVFLWASYVGFQRKLTYLPYVYVLAAILFNPVFKVTFSKETWMVLDIAAGLLLAVTARKLRPQTPAGSSA